MNDVFTPFDPPIVPTLIFKIPSGFGLALGPNSAQMCFITLKIGLGVTRPYWETSELAIAWTVEDGCYYLLDLEIVDNLLILYRMKIVYKFIIAFNIPFSPCV